MAPNESKYYDFILASKTYQRH